MFSTHICTHSYLAAAQLLLYTHLAKRVHCDKINCWGYMNLMPRQDFIATPLHVIPSTLPGDGGKLDTLGPEPPFMPQPRSLFICPAERGRAKAVSWWRRKDKKKLEKRAGGLFVLLFGSWGEGDRRLKGQGAWTMKGVILTKFTIRWCEIFILSVHLWISLNLTNEPSQV